MQVRRNRTHATRRIATVGAFLCSILAVGSVGNNEVRATTMIRCSTALGAGVVIDTEAEFNAAANKVNVEACNWIDIAGNISFTADPQFIYREDATSISVSGPTGGATLSGKSGVGPGATHVGALIITMVQPTGVEISNLTFEDFKDPSTTSTIGENGGALAIDFDSPSTVTIRNSTFRRNRAYSGGALATEGSVEIFDSIFEDNTALGNAGGAVLHGGGSLTLDNVTFVDNSARLHGGAIHTSGSIEVIDSIFESNSAYGGGAIFVYDTGSSPVNSLKVTGSTFRTNEASADKGGAIDAPGVEVLQSSFVNNSALGGGGAIWVSSSAGISNSTFSVNSESNGGALMIDENSTATSIISFSTLVQLGSGSLIDAAELVPLRLVGSVLVGSSVVCVDETLDTDGEVTENPLNLSTSHRSFVSDDSCGGSAGATTINTSYSTLSELGLSETLSTDVGAGKQVLALSSDSVLHSSVPLSLLPSGVTTDQLGLARFSSNGLTAAGALRGYTYVAPPVVPTVVPEIPVVETVKPTAPIVPAVAARSVVEDGRVVIRGSSPANIGRRVKVMVRLRGTKRFVPADTKVVNKLGRFKWSPVTGNEAEVYFVVGGVASDPVMLAQPRKP